MSKKIVVLISVLIIAALPLAACQPSPPQAEEPAAEEPVEEESEVEEPVSEETAILTVSQWGYNSDVFEEVFAAPFMEMYNVELVYETGNNADRLSKLESVGEATEVDVIHLSGNYALQAIGLGLLQKIDMSRLEHLDELYDWAKNPDGEGYCVSNIVVSYPIVYRTDKVDPPPTSWKDFLREDLKDRITMDDMPSTFGPSQVIMMSLAHGGEVDDYELGWEYMETWVDNMYTVAGYELTSLIQEGDIWMAAYGSYMTSALSEIDLPLELAFIPAEGVPGNTNVLCMVAGTDQEDLVYAWMNHLTSAETQTALAMTLTDAPTNKLVTLPDEIGSKLTYGDEYIDSLIFLDFAELNSLMPDWIDRWNDLVIE